MDRIFFLIDIAFLGFIFIVEGALIRFLYLNRQDFCWGNLRSKWNEQFECWKRKIWELEEPTYFEKIFLAIFQFFRSIAFSHINSGFADKDVRYAFIDFSVFTSFLVLYLCLRFNTLWLNSKCGCIIICLIVVPYLLSTMLGYNLTVTLLDGRFNRVDTSAERPSQVRSIERSVLLFAINYLIVIVGFAILYLATRSIEGIKTWTSALYFSVVTITTLGSNNIYPRTGLGSTFVGLELIIGIILLVIVFETFITFKKGWDQKGEAWYNKARRYALKGDKSNALENLSKAIGLDAQFKEEAKSDKDFKKLWDDEDFLKIVS